MEPARQEALARDGLVWGCECGDYVVVFASWVRVGAGAGEGAAVYVVRGGCGDGWVVETVARLVDHQVYLVGVVWEWMGD